MQWSKGEHERFFNRVCEEQKQTTHSHTNSSTLLSFPFSSAIFKLFSPKKQQEAQKWNYGSVLNSITGFTSQEVQEALCYFTFSKDRKIRATNM